MNELHLDDERTIACALGDLDSGEHELAAAHLATCAACAAAVGRLAAMFAAERARPDPGAPVHVLVRLLERQERAHLGRRRFWKRLSPVMAAAVLAAAMFAAGFWQGRQATPAPTAAAGASARNRGPLPPPPAIPVETAHAAGGDLAFSLAGAPGAANARAQDSLRDSL